MKHNKDHDEKVAASASENQAKGQKTTEFVADELEVTVHFDSSDMPTQSLATDPDATTGHVSKPSPRESRVEIPGYKILGELGRGAMGVVYKAKQELADRMVALKLMLHSDHAADSEISRFRVEAQASARLHHPNIVQVHDVGQVDDLPYFTLEYVDGGTLSRRLSKQSLSVTDSAKMMLTLAKAIAYAHSRGVVHRDLKPGNILLTRDGVPKIADFGLARRTDDVSHLTVDGTILGTPSYMAPEQARGDQREIGPLSDVYTLGAILYELLTGRPPFIGSSTWEVIHQVRSAEPTPPSMLEPKLPRDMETICIKCLQKAPDQRYGSAQLLADDLQRFLNNEPILARPVGSVERFVRLCQRYPREARLVGIVVALLILVAIGSSVAAYRFNEQRQELAHEKLISDQRLTTYRSTVSPLVNEFPALVEQAPLAAGLYDDMMNLIGDVLDKSGDDGSVGPAKQWGQEAVALRQGDNLLRQATSDIGQSDKTDAVAERLSKAVEKYDEAERIARMVLDSHPEDMAKAYANMAHPISRRTAALRYLGRPLAEIAPLHLKAIEYQRNALAAEKSSDSVANAKHQSELGKELWRYGDFLLEQRTSESKRFATRALELAMEAKELLGSAIDSLPASENDWISSRLDYGLAVGVIARASERLEQFENADISHRESVEVLQKLCNEFPNRYSFRKLLLSQATAYGDFLLLRKADAQVIAIQYAIALRTLKSMDTSEQRFLRDGDLGLANQYYRSGLVALLEEDQAKSKQFFERCALVRQLAWLDQLESLDHSRGLDNVLTQRIELMIAQSRCGKTTSAIEHAEWLFQRAEQLVNDASTKDASAGGFEAKTLFMLASSGFALSSEHLSGGERAKQLQRAMDSIKKAIEYGYNNVAYLKTDPDLAPLQSLEEYKSLLSTIK